MRCRQQGFTLLEVLTAMALFAMLTAIVYAVLGPAGEGFRTLQTVRDNLGEVEQLADQLRLDSDHFAYSFDMKVAPLILKSDRRGDAAFDELSLTCWEPGQPAISRVRYLIDEASGMLVRESTLPWLRQGHKGMRWRIARAESFQVSVMDQHDHWHESWRGLDATLYPKALKIAFRGRDGEREWYLPMDAEPYRNGLPGSEKQP
jgi:prepilin-type N-terminal cleavage/methylation domain-containing protein